MTTATVTGVFWTSSKRRRRVTLAVLAVIILVAVVLGRTHPVAPRGGATYTGTVVVANPSGKVIGSLAISFAVSRSGRRVGAFHFPDGIPRSCGAGTLGRVSVLPASAPLEHPNRFEVNLALTTDATRVGTLEIAGTFGAFSRERGAVSARFASPRGRACDASGGYSAKATPAQS